MTIRSFIAAMTRVESINFVLTNGLPGRSLTRLMGRFSRVEQPLVRELSLFVWRLFSDLDLSEAKKTQFRSMNDCFTRELKPGARMIDADPAVLVSPCDAIVGATGRLHDLEMLQVKGSRYSLADLVGDVSVVEKHRDGRYVTLRLTSSTYHRFHAPHDARMERVTRIPGDAWNVNPATLKRVKRVFCRNERAVIEMRLDAGGHAVTLVPVAAILVASLRLHAIDATLGFSHRGVDVFHPDSHVEKGAELGFFQHGSTIILLAPASFQPCATLAEGNIVRMGEALMRLPSG